MANKLFYTLSKDNAGAFIKDDVSKSALGIVKSEANEPFGYFVTYGLQVGASYADLTAAETRAYNSAVTYTAKNYATQASVQQSIASINTSLEDYAKKTDVVNTTGSGSFMADGIEYTVKVEDGVLSVVQYIKPTISSVTFTPSATTSITDSGKTVEYFVGESYNIAYNIASPASGNANIKVYNPTGGNFKVTFTAGGNVHNLQKSDGFTQDGTSSYWICTYAWGDYPASKSGNITGTVNYAADAAKSVSSAKSFTFNIVNPDKDGEAASSKNASINYSVATTISCQYPYYIGETLPGTEITTTAPGWHVNQYGTRPSTITVTKGNTSYFVVPTVIGTPKFDNAGFAVTPEETDITVNSINGKTLSGHKTYKAYKVVAASGDVTLNIKW